MSSVQERIKRLNELESGIKAPLPTQYQHQHHGNDHNRGQSRTTSDKSYTPTTAKSTVKDKAHLFKAAKLIQKSFSADSAEGDAPFLSSPKKQPKKAETKSFIPSDDRNQSHASLSDDDDGEFDAAAAMSYWRSRTKGNQNNGRKEERENSLNTTTATKNQVSSPLVKTTTTQEGQKFNNEEKSTLNSEKDPVVLPLSPPRLQHKQSPQSNFHTNVFGSRDNKVTKRAEEEAPLNVTAAALASPTNDSANYDASSPMGPILSVKSSETVLSGATDTSCVSTLSTRAKKFLKEKRKNGPILTGRGTVNVKADNLGKEANLLEKTSKDRLQRKVATLAVKAPPTAAGEADDLGHFASVKRSELGEGIAEIKSDIPFDEPSKENNMVESTIPPNQLENQSQSSQKSDIIRVIQQESYHVDNDGSLSEFTNQSEMNSTVTDSLTSDHRRRGNRQKKNTKAEKAITNDEEGVGESILDTFGALAEDAGCQVIEAFEQGFESLANAFKASFEDEKVAAANDVPFDEDVAIEVEYVEPSKR